MKSRRFRLLFIGSSSLLKVAFKGVIKLVMTLCCTGAKPCPEGKKAANTKNKVFIGMQMLKEMEGLQRRGKYEFNGS